jgi:SAM-dependent methyltransferase
MHEWLDKPDAHLDPVVAAAYDASYADESSREAITATVDRLIDLADGGRMAEFAIGTGRIAVPLAERGASVAGVDFSEAMLDELRAKPGADRIDVAHGDMTTTVLGDDFTLVYLVFNTIMNLRTQDDQVACFENAARHLRPGGRFVVECMVPELSMLAPGERYRPFDVSPEHLGFDEYVDPIDQILVSHHYFIDEGRARQSSNAFRYVWPTELDLMARLAGLALEARHADWTGAPFTADSPSHVSVWTKP